MTLVSGSRLGPYQITAKLGAGGMGEVYRATDTKLGREVAIKVLPEHFTKDRERLARFEREARLLAQLNHPNIAAIYGLEEADGIRALVLELVEGPTLAERLASGPFPFNESLSVSLQIALALEEAHDKGIIHRDLKPQNIKASIEGKVKVLDFGLAKAMDPLSAGPETPSQLAQSPTLTFGATMQGVILGTAAYMSPEQAKGMTVDKRADIWAFGVVLYEMLTGTSLFIGDSIPDTLARVLQREIDWGALPESTPPAIRQLLRRCLERNPKNRLHDIADARLVLEEVARGEGEASLAGAAPVGDVRRSTLFRFWPVVLLLVAAAGVLGGRYSSQARVSPPRALLRASLTVPPELQVSLMDGYPAARLTRDGSSLFFIAVRRDDPKGESSLYRRRLDSLESYEPVPVPGTSGIWFFWISSDGRWLDFIQPSPGDPTTHRIVRIPQDLSAPPLEISPYKPDWRDWIALDNGDSLVILTGGRLLRLKGDTTPMGEPVPIDVGRTGEFAAMSRPTVAPDGRVLLQNYSAGQSSTVLVDPTTGKGTIVVENAFDARYVESGHLLFTRGPVLLGARFDIRIGRLVGAPVALTSGLGLKGDSASAPFDLSPDGTLIFATGGTVVGQLQLVVVKPGSTEATAWSSERREFDGDLAIDGHSAYAGLLTARGSLELWKLPRDGPPQPVVALAGVPVVAPVVSPDGRQLAFQRYGNDKDDGVYLVGLPEGGSPRLLRQIAGASDFLTPTSYLSDSRRLLVTLTHKGQHSVVELAVDKGAEAEPRVLIPASARSAVISPGDRWLAFVSDSSGRREVYVAAYRREGSLGPRSAVSRNGGDLPRWSPDGRKLYFVEGEQRLLAASISADGTPTGEPTLAADLRALRAVGGFQVLPDGRLLLIQKGEHADEGIRQFDLIFGFGEELKRRIP